MLFSSNTEGIHVLLYYLGTQNLNFSFCQALFGIVFMRSTVFVIIYFVEIQMLLKKIFEVLPNISVLPKCTLRCNFFFLRFTIKLKHFLDLLSNWINNTFNCLKALLAIQIIVSNYQMTTSSL